MEDQNTVPHLLTDEHHQRRPYKALTKADELQSRWIEQLFSVRWSKRLLNFTTDVCYSAIAVLGVTVSQPLWAPYTLHIVLVGILTAVMFALYWRFLADFSDVPVALMMLRSAPFAIGFALAMS